MVRVTSRAPSLGRSQTAVDTARRREKKPSYKLQFDLVPAAKKRLHLHVSPLQCQTSVPFVLIEHLQKTDRTQPPQGYTFLAIGHADLADKCKELSRDNGVPVNVVSVRVCFARQLGATTSSFLAAVL